MTVAKHNAPILEISSAMLLLVIIGFALAAIRLQMQTSGDNQTSNSVLRVENVIALLRTEFRHAGYRPLRQGQPLFESPASSIQVDNNIGLNNSDTLSIYYHADTDCSGKQTTYHTAIDHFQLINDAGTTALACNNRIVLPNVINFQIEYGKDLNQDLSAEHFIDPSSNTNLQNILLVRIHLTVVNPANKQTKTYTSDIELHN